MLLFPFSYYSILNAIQIDRIGRGILKGKEESHARLMLDNYKGRLIKGREFGVLCWLRKKGRWKERKREREEERKTE